MSEIQSIDENEVFYQAKHKTADIWQSCSKEDYSDFQQMSWMEVRVLWTGGAALKKLSTAFKRRNEKHKAAYEDLKGKYHELKARSEIDTRTIQALKAKLVVNMIKYLGATKTQAKEIVDGVFDGEETFNREKG